MVARRALTLALLLALAPPAWGGSLQPSREGLLRQVEGARELASADREADVRAMVAAGELVRVRGNGDYELKSGNPWPYAREEVVRFLEDLGRDYRQACGERLVVTSLVRPRNRQPRNASPMSVHPTGAALDLRMHWRRACRSWLERELAALEDAGVVEAARELRPPHYHVALLLGSLAEQEGAQLAAVAALATTPPAAAWARASEYRYLVQRGDTLWGIARRYGVEPAAILAANGLSSSSLSVGQPLRVPADARLALAAPAAPSPTYRVRPGDNLWRIALRHGTVVGLIQQVNGLSSTRIFPGQLLRIPSTGR
ncbi:MAG: DUF5715 family protein [Thermoanaerobaculia bacterium]